MSKQENISIHWNFAGLDTENSRKVIEAEIDIITRDILPNQFLELCKIIYQQLTVACLSQVSMAEFWQLVAGENPDKESKKRATGLINALIRYKLAAKNPPDIPDGPSAYYLKREVLELLFSTNSLKEFKQALQERGFENGGQGIGEILFEELRQAVGAASVTRPSRTE